MNAARILKVCLQLAWISKEKKQLEIPLKWRASKRPKKPHRFNETLQNGNLIIIFVWLGLIASHTLVNFCQENFVIVTQWFSLSEQKAYIPERQTEMKNPWKSAESSHYRALVCNITWKQTEKSAQNLLVKEFKNETEQVIRHDGLGNSICAQWWERESEQRATVIVLFWRCWGTWWTEIFAKADSKLRLTVNGLVLQISHILVQQCFLTQDNIKDLVFQRNWKLSMFCGMKMPSTRARVGLQKLSTDRATWGPSSLKADLNAFWTASENRQESLLYPKNLLNCSSPSQSFCFDRCQILTFRLKRNKNFESPCLCLGLTAHFQLSLPLKLLRPSDSVEHFLLVK